MKRWPVAVALVTGAVLLVGCSAGMHGRPSATAPSVTLTDMLGRRVLLPRDVHRVLALHPIPTTLLELLAPKQIVSVDSVFERSLVPDDARFSAEQMSSLRSLPVTGVYFSGFDPEQLIKLHPDVVITMTGDTNIDREQQQTNIPFFAVSKTPTASYESTIRLIGQIVGQQNRADQMAAFWAQTIASVTARTASVPPARRPVVMYTGKNGDILGVPGKDTVFGSSIDTAGGRYVGDQLSGGHADTENNPVSLEQVITWNPDAIIVASVGARARITHDPRWQSIQAVRDGHVYVPRQYGGLDGLQAIVGMAWIQTVLLDHDDAHGHAALTATMQRYYDLFYGHPLTSTQLDQLSS